jgi:predicted MFS family arabinose efflux permease
MLALMSLLVIPYATLLPIYAKVIFHGNATTFGLIDSFIGMGAISCALWLASRNVNTEMAMKKTLRINTIIFGIGLILFSHTEWFPLAMVFAVISGFGMMAETTMTNTIIQMSVVPEMRGRVISYFAMAYFGMMPLGSLLVGFISQYAGAQNTILGQGVIALVIVGLFWKHLTKAPGVPPRENRGMQEREIGGRAESSRINSTITNTSWKQTAKH